MGICTLENLRKQKKKDISFIIIIKKMKKMKEIDKKDNIKNGIKMEKLFIILKIGNNMKAILKMIKKLIRVLFIITMEIGKWGNILKEKSWESCYFIC